MSNLYTERVLSVHHWNDTLFSFKTTRNPGEVAHEKCRETRDRIQSR